MEKIYYLDNAATTKTNNISIDILNKSIDEFYNPSSAYKQAISVKNNLDNARKILCDLLGGKNGKVIFTSSATESNNMFFMGVHLRKGQTVLISKAEHPSVYLAAHRLEKFGIIVKDIPLEKTGAVDFETYKKMLDESVALVSIIHVSNETGIINNIKDICAYTKKYNKNIIFHSDGVQAFGKIKVDLNVLGVDLYTISAHKVYAPRGIAALWIKNGVVIDPLLVGGGQEMGLRSSTENYFGAVSFAQIAQNVILDLDKNNAKVLQNRQNLIDLLRNSEIFDYIEVNESENQSPYILSISVPGIKGEVLANSLERDGILISTGSACSSKKAGNRTLEAMGKTNSEVIGSVRISFSAYDDYDINYIAGKLIENILRFKNII